jgi:hypothetical protein
MRELADQLPPPAGPRRARDLIGAELGKAPLRLTRGQAARLRAQMRQQRVDPLLRIDSQRAEVPHPRRILGG